MCIYCGTDKYRKIYEAHCGPIPKDSVGRTYDIHHIDGNRKNNDPTNLRAVTINEHYDIHYSQGDFSACMLLAPRIKLTGSEISELAKKNARKLVENGTHLFVGDSNPVYRQLKEGTHLFLDKNWQKEKAARQIEAGTNVLLGGEIQRKANSDRINAGTHNFLGPDLNRRRVAAGTHHFLGDNNPSVRKVKLGTHHFLGPKCNQDRVKNGTHNFVGPNSPSQVDWTCPHCGKHGKGKGNYTRAHGDNCKNNKVKINKL